LNPYASFPVITADLEEVDRVIKQRLDSPVALIGTIADYIIGAGGKRLRPVLLLLFARALGYGRSEAAQSPGHHWLLAAVVEFIHTATLLHDDIVDESTLRRGRPTANAQFGNAAAVLVGDFLYSRAFQMMVEVDQMKVQRILADATNTIAEGEVLQLMNCRDPGVDERRTCASSATRPRNCLRRPRRSERSFAMPAMKSSRLRRRTDGTSVRLSS
jgi:octaprenyl-diphosphate synthase